MHDPTKINKTIREIRKEKDHYKLVKTASDFNNNYIQYENIGDKNKNLSIKEYIDIIRPYLSDITNNHKTQGEWKIHSGNILTDYKTQEEWKIHLKIAIKFQSSKGSHETRIVHSKSDNIEIMMGGETDEIIKEIFESLLQRYPKGLEESIKESELVFDSVDSLYYKLHKISLNRSGSYIDSPNWLKK